MKPKCRFCEDAGCGACRKWPPVEMEAPVIIERASFNHVPAPITAALGLPPDAGEGQVVEKIEVLKRMADNTASDDAAETWAGIINDIKKELGFDTSREVFGDSLDDGPRILEEIRRRNVVFNAALAWGNNMVHGRDHTGDGYSYARECDIEVLCDAVDKCQKNKGSVLESLDRVYEAGGKAWDDVADPDRVIAEMRGKDHPHA